MKDETYIDMKNAENNEALNDARAKKVIVMSSVALVLGVLLFLGLFALIG